MSEATVGEYLNYAAAIENARRVIAEQEDLVERMESKLTWLPLALWYAKTRGKPVDPDRLPVYRARFVRTIDDEFRFQFNIVVIDHEEDVVGTIDAEALDYLDRDGAIERALAEYRQNKEERRQAEIAELEARLADLRGT